MPTLGAFNGPLFHAANYDEARLIIGSANVENGRGIGILIWGVAVNAEVFTWSPDSTASDDDANVLKPTDIDSLDPGRWILQAKLVKV